MKFGRILRIILAVLLVFAILGLSHFVLTFIPVCGYLDLIGQKPEEGDCEDEEKEAEENDVRGQPPGSDHQSEHNDGNRVPPVDGGRDVGDGTYTYENGGISYFSCEHALQESRKTDTLYRGDCPWPRKSLTSQTGGDALIHNSKRWITQLAAIPGMTTEGDAGKMEIIRNCCPERVDTHPMCVGKLVGSSGIPNSARGGYKTQCSAVTLGEWRGLNRADNRRGQSSGQIYTTGGIATRMAGRYDDRGNLLTAISNAGRKSQSPDFHGLATQCNRGTGGGDDSETVGSKQPPGQSADGSLCLRPPGDT